MKIQIDVLRAALNQLLDHAKEIKGDFIEVDVNYYWFIPRVSLYEAASVPTELTLGSLQDDWSEMSAISDTSKEPFGYALVWAAALVRELGDQIP